MQFIQREYLLSNSLVLLVEEVTAMGDAGVV